MTPIAALYVVFSGELIGMTPTAMGPQPMILPMRADAVEDEVLASLSERVRADPAFVGKSITIARFGPRETVATIDRTGEHRVAGRPTHDPFRL